MNKRLFISALLAIVLSCNNAIFADIFEAVEKGNLEEVKEIVNKNPDAVNKRSEFFFEMTPLFFAAQHGLLDIVKYLVQKGAKLNHMDDYGRTPLTFAAQYGLLDIVKYLIQNGANPNLTDQLGRTPLFYASFKGYLDIVKYLIQNGANPNHKTEQGKTALYYTRVKAVAEYLRRIQNFSRLSKKAKINFILDNLNQGWIKDILSFVFATSMLEFYRNPPIGLNSTLFGQLFKQAKQEKKLLAALQKKFDIQILESDSLYTVITKILAKDKIDIAVTKTARFRKLLEKERMKEQRIQDLLERAQYLLEEL